MGADCCAPDSLPAAQHMLNDLHLNNAENQGGDTDKAASAKTHKEHADELKDYIKKRIELFDQYKSRDDAQLEKAKQVETPIKVTLPDGSEKPGVKLVTTPMDIAKSISKSLANNAVVAKVDGKEWDLLRPLEADCKMSLHTFEEREGKETFWHSSAHVLGEALEDLFGVRLTIGPHVEEGFYYDCYMGDRTLTDAEKPLIEKKIAEIVKEKQRFQRVVVSREEALSMFQENKFKVEIITGLPEDATISLYRCGPMVDLCHGPHLPNTGYLKSAAVGAVNRAFWRADVKREPLQRVHGVTLLDLKQVKDCMKRMEKPTKQSNHRLGAQQKLFVMMSPISRVYGVTFPDKKLLEDYKMRMEEAKKRDHRRLGTQQKLFFFDPVSPGSAFFLPRGMTICKRLIQYIQKLYEKYEYEEVGSPNIYNFELWNTSGHAAHYKENMFVFQVEKQEFGLKPMNCPGHCVMFGHSKRSYRELPLRYADFGVLHRNEFSGALAGLTRVRRFQQDDAHIFCRADQVLKEVSSVLDMLAEVYKVFGLTYKLALSTRPEGYLGTLEQWDAAEAALTDALNKTGLEWELNPADGAFYGPKIDITVFDALRRKFQCATVQLDFQLPIRFKLEYVTEDVSKPERPVIIHRAILGSVERMFAILCEHYAGKWPFWLSPRQVMVVPISAASADYAKEVKAALRSESFSADIDLADSKMEKKIREAQLEQYNYIVVVGETEKENRTVNVRTRDNARHGEHKLAELIEVLRKERDERSLVSCFGHKKAAQPAASNGAAENGSAQHHAA